MNEFIEQFILESRDLVEQASKELSALERSPQDAERIDATFRAIHTLKGGAAIVDFFAMERAVHAAEDALSAVRSGKRVITTTLIGDCFACIDQVSRWLDSMEQSGELPAGADAQADVLIARITGGAHGQAHDQGGHQTADQPDHRLIKQLSDRLELGDAVPSQARTVLRFTPRPDCFFRGEDPLALIASLPGLLSMELEAPEPWPSLEELDPFRCSLVVIAFSSASADAVSAHFRGHESECEIRAVGGESESKSDLTAAARKLLEAQLALLGEKKSETFVGRVTSAGLVAANVLRHHGQTSGAELIEQQTERSLDEKDSQYLREVITKILAPSPSPAPVVENIPESVQPEVVARSLRVDADRVDALVRLTAELTVVKNAIGHVLKLAEANTNIPAAALKGPHGDLNHLISELQNAVLGIRVLPLRTVLQRFPRVVREISAALDKPVKLLIDGDETEADKAIVEMLFEPLLHIVRNALDHGIETSAVRRERNKPAVATVRISASRQSSYVLVDVEDDGGGVDVARVRAVAQQRGVATPEALETMTDEEIVDLVFAAGFSTASKVTELSGRGVGMDAVRTAVERIGGRVTIDSRPGRGATVRVMLPFSVMLTHVMTVEAGGQMFGIPLDAVVETMSVPIEHISGIGAAQAIVRRNRTLPVFDLAALLQVREPRQGSGEALIVVTAVGGQWGGLRVERLGERMEVMLKPLEGLLLGMPGIAGTTILGDGRVLLVLDLADVLK